MSAVYVQGMHGLGDNIHQRALMRGLGERYDVIQLETSWPCVYRDMPWVRCVHKGTTLRTQAKNAAREADRFAHAPVDADAHLRIWYRPHEVRAHGSVLGAMLRSVGLDDASADFGMAVPVEWRQAAIEALRSSRWDGRPPLVYRPLVERREWGGCAARNPDSHTYRSLVECIRARFFVVSIADLVPGVEWISGAAIDADAEFHGGELSFETLAGMFSMARLAFTAPGFAVPLAQAIGTPVVCIHGGYESSRSFSLGARMSPTLGIDPMRPCDCFSHNHRCRYDKRIDMDAAIGRLEAFLADHA